MARRSRGEGTFRHRSDGRWSATISMGWGVARDGGPQRRRKTFYGRTRDEVKRQLWAALSSIDAGPRPTAGNQTVGQFLDDWLPAVRDTIAASTYDGYEHLIRLHIKPGLGRIKLSKLTPQEVQAWMNAKRRQPRLNPHTANAVLPPLSARTIQYAHAVLRHALATAVDWDLIPRNVASAAKPPRITRAPVEPLTPPQAVQLLSAADEAGDRLVNLYAVAIAEGLRQGELLGLKWQDVDGKAGQLWIVRSVQVVDGKPTFIEPKTHRSRRAIQLSQTGIQALQAQRELQHRERDIAGNRWKRDVASVFNDLVFTNSRGGPMDGTTVTMAFQRRLAESGLPRQRFHDLRHATATFLLAQDVPMKIVSEKLGHAQIGITMNLYSHVTLAMQQEAADRMDQLLLPAHSEAKPL
ncbi:MAG: tyrosine-type recombinase/integrase [Candidatus Dormibacteraceae bacterium]